MVHLLVRYLPLEICNKKIDLAMFVLIQRIMKENCFWYCPRDPRLQFLLHHSSKYLLHHTAQHRNLLWKDRAIKLIWNVPGSMCWQSSREAWRGGVFGHEDSTKTSVENLVTNGDVLKHLIWSQLWWLGLRIRYAAEGGMLWLTTYVWRSHGARPILNPKELCRISWSKWK